MRFNSGLNQMFVDLAMGTNTIACGAITANGAISAGANSITGGSLVLSNTSNQIVFGTPNTATINVAPATNRIYTIPNNGGNCNFIMSLNHQAGDLYPCN